MQMPKLHEKEIIRLDIDEVAELLDEVESGDSLTDKQRAFHEKTKVDGHYRQTVEIFYNFVGAIDRPIWGDELSDDDD